VSPHRREKRAGPGGCSIPCRGRIGNPRPSLAPPPRSRPVGGYSAEAQADDTRPSSCRLYRTALHGATRDPALGHRRGDLWATSDGPLALDSKRTANWFSPRSGLCSPQPRCGCAGAASTRPGSCISTGAAWTAERCRPGDDAWWRLARAGQRSAADGPLQGWTGQRCRFEREQRMPAGQAPPAAATNRSCLEERLEQRRRPKRPGPRASLPATGTSQQAEQNQVPPEVTGHGFRKDGCAGTRR